MKCPSKKIPNKVADKVSEVEGVVIFSVFLER